MKNNKQLLGMGTLSCQASVKDVHYMHHTELQGCNFHWFWDKFSSNASAFELSLFFGGNSSAYSCFFFNGYFIFLYFKCYPFPGFASWNFLFHPPSPCFYEGSPTPSTHFGLSSQALFYTGHVTFTGPRATSPIDAGQDPPLIYIWLESWISSRYTLWLVV